MNAAEAVLTHKARFPELADLPSEVLLLFAQSIAKEEQRHAQEMQEEHCAVCFAVLTEKERGEHGPASFNRTCTAHAKHRKSFDLRPVRRELGMGDWHKFPPFWRL